MSAFAWLPTALTLGNLYCGFVAICAASGRDPERFALAAGLVFIAIILDGLDGAAARLARKASAFGKELDSLADLVSFGIVPGLLLYRASDPFAILVRPDSLVPYGRAEALGDKVVLAFGALYTVCAALRLARYNVQHDAPRRAGREFLGLPSPAAAGAVASLVLLKTRCPADGAVFRAISEVLPLVGLVTSVLMVSRVPYPHFMKLLGAGRGPFEALVQVVVLLTLAWLFYWITLPAIFLAYVGYGLVRGILPARPVPADAAAGEPEPPA